MPTETWDVLLPDTIDPTGPESLADVAAFTRIGEYEDRAAFVDDCDRFDAMIVRVAEIDAEVLDAAESLQVVSKHGAGLDNVDIPAATERGVVVCNTPGANSRSVAEHALMLVLATRKRVLAADASVRRGEWERPRFTNRELAEDTLGLFGFGNIARELADAVVGLEMDLLAYDPYVDESETPAGVEMVSSTEALFERSDVVSIHAPLTDDTHHAVGRAELDALGSEGAIINTSRGGIVDEDALLDALDRDALGSAGLDVFEQEPPEEGSALFDREDVVLTPHIGGVTAEALERMSRGAAANVRTVYDGGVPESTVNADGLQRGE